MRTIPQEHFLRYLCSIPNTSAERIRDYCRRMGIGIFPSETYIEELLQEVTAGFPINYNPRDPSHEPSIAFHEKHRIRGMWHQTRAVTEAVALFKNNQVSSLLNGLLLTTLKPEQIVELLERSKHVSVIPEAISEYEHFYWNQSLLTMDEWAVYLDKAPVKSVASAALRAPKNMDGVRLVLSKVGIMPKNLDKEAMLTSVRDIGYMNYLESDGLPQGVSKARMMSSYGNVVIRTQDKLDEYTAGEENVIHEFYRKVHLAHRETKHKTLDELRGESEKEASQSEQPIPTVAKSRNVA